MTATWTPMKCYPSRLGVGEVLEECLRRLGDTFGRVEEEEAEEEEEEKEKDKKMNQL